MKRLLAALAVLAVLALASCTANTIDSAALTPDSTTATTLYVPTGTTDELLAQLVVEAGRLSEAIVQDDGDEALAARLASIWEAARPGVEQTAPDLVREFEKAMELLARGVTTRRPADADKAVRNLQALVAARAA